MDSQPSQFGLMDALPGTPSFPNLIQDPAVLSSYPLVPSATPAVSHVVGPVTDDGPQPNEDAIIDQVRPSSGNLDETMSQGLFNPDSGLGLDPSRPSSASASASIIDVDRLTGRMDEPETDGDEDAERGEQKRDLKRSFGEIEGSSDADGSHPNGGEIEGDEDLDREGDGDGDDADDTIVVLSEMDPTSGVGFDSEPEIKKPRRGRPPGSKSQKGSKPKSRLTPHAKKTAFTSSTTSTSRSRKLTPARSTNGLGSHHTGASTQSPSRASAYPPSQSILVTQAPSPTSAELKNDLLQLRAAVSPFSPPPHPPTPFDISAVGTPGVEGGVVNTELSEAPLGEGISTRIGSISPRKASKPGGVPSSPLSDAPEAGAGRDGVDADFEGVPSAPVEISTGSSRRGASSRFVDGGPSLRRGTPVGGDSKGKGKEVEGMDSQGDNDFPQLNNDYCEACKGIGRFLCCDGCPRSFHFLCLDPPIDFDNIPEEQWFCKECSIRRSSLPIPNPPPNIFGSLIHQVQTTNPIQFKLPALIRSHFKGVSVAPNGSYVNSEELRPMKADRTGFAVDRDPYRVKDGKGQILACYRCGGSAAPLEGSTELRSSVKSGKPAIEVASWRKMISCDYCNLHWHFDCLNPPLATMPQISKKWTCPLHADHVAPKVRVPKQGLEYINLTSPFQRNNGQIEVIPSADPNRVPFEDMLVNSKRYRVPESSIRLDFWRKAMIERIRLANRSVKYLQAKEEEEETMSEESDVEMSEDNDNGESESVGHEASSGRILSSSPPPPKHLAFTVTSEMEAETTPKVEQPSLTDQDLQEGQTDTIGSDIDAEGEIDPDYVPSPTPLPPSAELQSLNPSIESNSQSLKPETGSEAAENGQRDETAIPASLETSVPLTTSAPITSLPTIQKITLRFNRNSASPGPPSSQHPPLPPPTSSSTPVSASTSSRDERGTSLGSTNSLEGLDLSFVELSQLMAVRDLMQSKGRRQILEFLTS